jgi:D-glycero-alpha-D-manno-heptose-7-phosphate kinase
VYVLVHPHPDKVVWTGLLHSERVNSADQLKNRIVNRVLQWMDLNRNIEVVSVSDAPPNSGLGNSSSFIVGLLKALHAYKGEFPWPQEIAEEACYVEQKLLRENSGKQDAYAASLGGLIWLEISTNGKVDASRLNIQKTFVKSLSQALVFVDTGITRSSSEVQGVHKARIESGDGAIEASLKEISQIALDIRQALEHEDVHWFGRLTGRHWKIKSSMNPLIADDRIRFIYEFALKHGAIGGNLMGAGGGGHFMFVCQDKETASQLSKAMTGKGLRLLDLRFEMQGSSLTERL